MMKDWNAYSQSKAKQNEIAGGKPTVLEYALIKVVDNSLLLFLIVITFGFASVGIYSKINNFGVHDWFFDAAKLTLGVMLGVLTKERKRT